jgi:methyl-accepting chemotaxis protein
MNWFYDLKIQTKLLLGFLLVGSIGGFIGISGLVGINKISSASTLLYENVTIPMSELAIINTAFQRIRLNARDIVTASDSEEHKYYSAKATELQQEIDRNSALYEKAIKDSEGRRLFGEFTATRKAYAPLLNRVIELAALNEKKEAMALLLGDAGKASRVEQAAIEKLVEHNIGLAKKTAGDNESLAKVATWISLATMIGGTFFTLMIAFFTARSINLPVNVAVKVANSLAQGDLTVKVSVKSKDETGILLSAMKDMAGNLKKVLSAMNKTSSSVASSSEELSATVRQMTERVNDQASRANQIATAATEMAQTVGDIAHNASTIALSATDTLNTARDGEDVVTKTVEEVQKIAHAVSASSGLITSLGERSKQIGDIINVIKDIADQTNLLALNAAIEAARAGEQGRGFAVVADEVRKLAERTGKATTEIGSMITAIQEETVGAVSAMKESLIMVDSGVEFSKQAGEGLHRIVSSVNSLQVMVQQIASATEEMSTVSETISSDIEAIAGIAHETSGSTEEISKAANDLAALAVDLKNEVHQFKL